MAYYILKSYKLKVSPFEGREFGNSEGIPRQLCYATIPVVHNTHRSHYSGPKRGHLDGSREFSTIIDLEDFFDKQLENKHG